MLMKDADICHHYLSHPCLIVSEFHHLSLNTMLC